MPWVIFTVLLTKNVLARLAEPPPPANLETAHTVTEAPVANAGRYNHLLAEVDHA